VLNKSAGVENSKDMTWPSLVMPATALADALIPRGGVDGSGDVPQPGRRGTQLGFFASCHLSAVLPDGTGFLIQIKVLGKLGMLTRLLDATGRER
jgi:hypothetical protein